MSMAVGFKTGVYIVGKSSVPLSVLSKDMEKLARGERLFNYAWEIRGKSQITFSFDPFIY